MVRSKIVLKKIEHKSNRQTTFSKRRTGLFKKANELCEISSAQVGVITFSMAGNVYASGHPSVDTVINEYLARTLNEERDGLQAKYAEALVRLETEKKREEILERAKVKNGGVPLWHVPVEDLELEEIDEIITVMEDMKEDILNQNHEGL